MDAIDEIVDIRDVGKDIVRHNEISLMPFVDQLLRKRCSKEGTPSWYTLLLGEFSDIFGGLDSKYWHSKWAEMLQKITVIGRQLDYQALNTKPQSVLDHLAIGFCVRYPRSRIR